MRYPLVERRDPIFPSSVNWQSVARSSIVDALRGHFATPSSLGEVDLAVDPFCRLCHATMIVAASAGEGVFRHNKILIDNDSDQDVPWPYLPDYTDTLDSEG